MTHRFLHLSDIHFGQEKHGTLVTHENVRNALVKDAKELTKKRGRATRILITGDVAYSGKPKEYDAAADWLEKLTQACECEEETHVCPIPGNHDCDLDAITYQARMIYGQLRASGPEVVQAILDGINKDGEPSNPFLPKLHAYSQFANAYGYHFESPSRPFWVRDFDLAAGIKLRFLGFTSVQVSDRDDAEGKMVFGNQQYTIEEHDNVVKVALVHHPLNWFIDKKEASQHLCNKARVIMVGHEHTLNIQKTSDAFTKKEWLVIYAGATNPPQGKEIYNYAYNWLEFSCQEKEGRHNLIVDVFPRVWIQERVCFDADRNRLGESGESVRIEIACPNLHPAPEPKSVGAVVHEESSTAITQEGPLPQIPSTAEAVVPGQGGSTMSSDTAGFDRLRYLFWRYLDWQQRLKVLVAVDALPKTADQPVPQTLERVALEAASQSRGKLHDLWEAMMPLIPEDKRAANPFKSN